MTVAQGCPGLKLNTHCLGQRKQAGLIATETQGEGLAAFEESNKTVPPVAFKLSVSCTMLTVPWIVDPVSIAPRTTKLPQAAESRSNKIARATKRRRVTDHPLAGVYTSFMGVITRGRIG